MGSPTPPAAPPKTLRGWLRAHPEKSQAWLARRAGIRQSFVSMLAAGQRTARGKVALLLQKLTGLPLEAFVLPHPPRKRKRGPPTRAAAPSTTRRSPQASRRADDHTDDDTARPLAH